MSQQRHVLEECLTGSDALHHLPAIGVMPASLAQGSIQRYPQALVKGKWYKALRTSGPAGPRRCGPRLARKLKSNPPSGIRGQVYKGVGLRDDAPQRLLALGVVLASLSEEVAQRRPHAVTERLHKRAAIVKGLHGRVGRFCGAW